MTTKNDRDDEPARTGGAWRPSSWRTSYDERRASPRCSPGINRLQREVVHADGVLAFLTYDDEHHRFAIAAIPGSKISRRWPRAPITSRHLCQSRRPALHVCSPEARGHRALLVHQSTGRPPRCTTKTPTRAGSSSRSTTSRARKRPIAGSAAVYFAKEPDRRGLRSRELLARYPIGRVDGDARARPPLPTAAKSIRYAALLRRVSARTRMDVSRRAALDVKAR